MPAKRYFKWIIATAFGLILSLAAFRMATDPGRGERRALEQAVVLAAREILNSYVIPGGDLQRVDPLSPDRKIGKSYVWPVEGGWDVSGFYRRDDNDNWHPFLMSLDESIELRSLAVRDSNERLMGMSVQDQKFSAVP